MEKQISIVASEDYSIILANATINCSVKSNNEGTLIVPCDFMSEIILDDLVDNGFLEPVIIKDIRMYKTTDNEVIIWQQQYHKQRKSRPSLGFLLLVKNKDKLKGFLSTIRYFINS